MKCNYSKILKNDKFIYWHYFQVDKMVVFMSRGVIWTLVLIGFVLGLIVSGISSYFYSESLQTDSGIESEVEFQETQPDVTDADNAVFDNNYNGNYIIKMPELPSDLPSPYDWIKEEQIFVQSNGVYIKIPNAVWARFTDTNSMDPVLDSTANAIEIIPSSADDIHVGDIVSYNPRNAEGTIIHRVVDVGSDEDGAFFVFKGDNNEKQDPEKVRFEQIERIVVAVIY